MYRSAALVGTGVAFVSLYGAAFFLYNASTYKESAEAAECRVSELALQPKRGGPKNLPILDVLINNDNTDEKRAVKDKPRLVILGGG